MARKLEGSVAEPGSSTTATAQGHTWNGIYWLLCTTILFGLITYGREKGFKNLLREFFTPPFTFFDNLVRRPRSAIAMGCWGAALALLVGSVVSNAISGLLGLGFLLAAPTALAIVLNNVLIRGWTGVFSAMQPRLKHNAAALANPYAMMFGEAIGALIAWRASGAIVPVVLALILIVVSFVVVAGGAGKALPNPMPLILLDRRGHRHVEGAARHTRPRGRRRMERVRDRRMVTPARRSASSGDGGSGGSPRAPTSSSAKDESAARSLRSAASSGACSAAASPRSLPRSAARRPAASAAGSRSCRLPVAPRRPAPRRRARRTESGPRSASRRSPAPACRVQREPRPRPARPRAPGTPAPHSVGQPLASTGTPGAGAPAGTGAPAGSGAASGGPPSAVAGRASRQRAAPGQPPPPPPPPGAPPGPAPSGAPHGIAQGTEGLHGHAGQPADVTPTGAARTAPDVTPRLRARLTLWRARTASHKEPKASTATRATCRRHPDRRGAHRTRRHPGLRAGLTRGAPHGIAQGTEGLHGHAGQPADVTPTGAAPPRARRHARPSRPSGRRHAHRRDPRRSRRDADRRGPPRPRRHARPSRPSVRHHPDRRDAWRSRRDAGHPGGAAQPPPPPPGQQPPTPGRHMLDDVLPDEDKFDEEDGEGRRRQADVPPDAAVTDRTTSGVPLWAGLLTVALASTSILSLLADLYGVMAMGSFFWAITVPSLIGLVVIGCWPSPNLVELQRRIRVGVFGGVIGTIGYDLIRVPFAVGGTRVFVPIDTYGLLITRAHMSSSFTVDDGMAVPPLERRDLRDHVRRRRRAKALAVGCRVGTHARDRGARQSVQGSLRARRTGRRRRRRLRRPLPLRMATRQVRAAPRQHRQGPARDVPLPHTDRARARDLRDPAVAAAVARVGRATGGRASLTRGGEARPPRRGGRRVHA